MNESLEGKVVIITGASTGIGAAAARLFVPLGAKVAVTARSVDKLNALAAELGDAVLPVAADVTQPADVQRIVDATLERFGRIDVLFANAGIYIPGQFADGDPDAFAHLLNVNIVGVMRCVHAVLPHMMAQSSGDIIITSSISGFVDIDWEPVYSASKHAIQGFVHTVRRQVMGKGIRLMSLAPGMVANELWNIHDPAVIAEHVANRTALTSDDCAETALFMLTRPRHVTIRDLVMLPQNQDI
jgi:ribitol 2-dehydrogenase